MKRVNGAKPLVVILGPPAVGKMTVGLELQKLTGFQLFPNHLLIELVQGFHALGSPEFLGLVSEFRSRLFAACARGPAAGLIFPYCWALDESFYHNELLRYCAAFGIEPGDTCYAELSADQAQRIARNKSESRLGLKRTKADTRETEAYLIQADRRHRYNSAGDFPYPDHHLCIDNNQLPAAEAARLIQARFGLPLDETYHQSRRNRQGLEPVCQAARGELP